jgi:hypothetical protein
LVITVGILRSSEISYSQKQLDEVILSNKTIKVYIDDFSTYNKTISTFKSTSFKDILKSTDTSQSLVFKTNTVTFKINKRSYLYFIFLIQ